MTRIRALSNHELNNEKIRLLSGSTFKTNEFKKLHSTQPLPHVVFTFSIVETHSPSTTQQTSRDRSFCVLFDRFWYHLQLLIHLHFAVCKLFCLSIVSWASALIMSLLRSFHLVSSVEGSAKVRCYTQTLTSDSCVQDSPVPATLPQNNMNRSSSASVSDHISRRCSKSRFLSNSTSQRDTTIPLVRLIPGPNKSQTRQQQLQNSPEMNNWDQQNFMNYPDWQCLETWRGLQLQKIWFSQFLLFRRSVSSHICCTDLFFDDAVLVQPIFLKPRCLFKLIRFSEERCVFTISWCRNGVQLKEEV